MRVHRSLGDAGDRPCGFLPAAEGFEGERSDWGIAGLSGRQDSGLEARCGLGSS